MLDSGLWISALHFGGTPRIALNTAAERTGIAMCSQIESEIRRILITKLRWTPNKVTLALDSFAEATTDVAVSGRIRGVCRDADDDMVLECALVARATQIITGDKDLLELKEYRRIRIITPREFLDSVAV